MKKLVLLLVGMLILLLPVNAFAAGDAQLTLHFKQTDSQELDIWAWSAGADGGAYPFTGEDDYGKVAEIKFPGAADAGQVAFIVRTADWSYKSCTEDLFVDLVDGKAEVWIEQGSCDFTTTNPGGGATTTDTAAAPAEMPKTGFGGTAAAEERSNQLVVWTVVAAMAMITVAVIRTRSARNRG